VSTINSNCCHVGPKYIFFFSDLFGLLLLQLIWVNIVRNAELLICQRKHIFQGKELTRCRQQLTTRLDHLLVIIVKQQRKCTLLWKVSSHRLR